MDLGRQVRSSSSSKFHDLSVAHNSCNRDRALAIESPEDLEF